ncbi:MAG: AI-2E family transporter [Candidatus Moraniibacteriota bacterium]|jgi:predicted PurR-regulated permease PerM
MNIKNLNIYFFFALLVFASFAAFLLIKPFLIPIFVAALLAVIFAKPYNFFLKKLKSSVAASIIMLCVVTITIILPFIFVGGLVFNEVADVIIENSSEESSMQSSIEKVMNIVIQAPVFNVVLERAEEYVNGPEIGNLIKNVANNSISFIQTAYKGIINSTIAVFVMFFTLFYFFIDGKKIVKKIMDLSPMRNTHEQKLIDEFISMTRATLKGTVVIGFIQGAIGGIAFAIAGVISPILWTVIMVIMGVIPAVGAGLIIFPAAMIMFLLGNIWQSIFLLIVGIFVSTIDNVLRPKLVGKDVQMHSLAVFFATIGGLKLFGIMGFIIGPIIVALMLAMWKIYALEFKQQLQKFNS